MDFQNGAKDGRVCSRATHRLLRALGQQPRPQRRVTQAVSAVLWNFCTVARRLADIVWSEKRIFTQLNVEFPSLHIRKMMLRRVISHWKEKNKTKHTRQSLESPCKVQRKGMYKRLNLTTLLSISKIQEKVNSLVLTYSGSCTVVLLSLSKFLCGLTRLPMHLLLLVVGALVSGSCKEQVL